MSGPPSSPRLAALDLACPACGARTAAEASGGVRCRGCGALYPETGGILRLVAGSSGAPGYDPHYFASLPRIESRHFWFVARREVILDGLRRHVPDLAERPLFDIGCGTGGLLAYLGSQGVRLAGACDAYSQALEIARTRLDVPVVLVDEGRLPPLAPGHRLLGMFDVLEHIDDDRGTLAWLASVLEAGGYLVLTVPAHPFLFDESDERAHHRRRYRRGELRDKLEAAGFTVVLLTHFMAPLVPVLAALRAPRRLLGARTDEPRGWDNQLRVVPGVNQAFQALLAVERRALRLVRPPFGSSLLAIARAPGLRA